MISRIKSIMLGNWGGRFACTSVIVSGLMIIFHQFGVFQGAELRNYDLLMRLRKDKKPDDRLLVVRITDDDLDSRQEPVIYDVTLAKAMNKLQQYQPALIGVDVDRSIPVPKLASGEKRAALENELTQPNVVVVCALSGYSETFDGTAPPPEVDPSQVGYADLSEDIDGVTRKTFLYTFPPEPIKEFENPHLCNDYQTQSPLLSFAFQTSLIYLNSLNVPIEETEDLKIKLGETILEPLESNSGSYQNEDMGGYTILIDYRNRIKASQTVTLSELLDNQVDPQLIQNRIILIGYDSLSIPDVFLTPFSGGSDDENAKMLGVMVHAQIISQLLSVVLDGQKLITYLPQAIEWLWIISWSIVGGLLTFRGCKQLWLVAVVNLASIALLLTTAIIAMMSFSLWIPIAPPLIALIFTTVGTILIDRIPAVQKMLKINIEIDWEQVRKDADKLVSASGGMMKTANENLSEIEQVDLEAAENAAKESYLDALQQRAKERRKKKYNCSTEYPKVEMETDQPFFWRLQNKITNLKTRLNSRMEKQQPKVENSINMSYSTNTSGQTLEQQAEIQQIEQYIEEVLQRARSL